MKERRMVANEIFVDDEALLVRSLGDDDCDELRRFAVGAVVSKEVTELGV